MDPLSVLAGVAGLLALAIKTMAALDDYKTTAKDAPAEIQSLLEELQLLTGILRDIERSVSERARGAKKGGGGDDALGGDTETLVKTVAGCQAHLSRALAMLEEYGMGTDVSRTAGARYKTLFKRLKYPFDRDYVQRLLTVIRDYKATLTLALSLEGKKSMDVLQSTLSRLEAVSVQSQGNMADIREQNNKLLAALIMATENIRPPPSYSDATRRGGGGGGGGGPEDRLFEVPQHPTATFVGRADVLADIERHFRREAGAEPRQRRCAVYGLGGGGKSQVALKYAFAHRSAYRHVLFVNAASEQSAAADLARVHGLLRLSAAPDDRGRIEAVKKWLSREGNASWLLVIDNADDLDELDLWDYIPVVEAGDILITTRDGRIADPELSTLAIHLEMLAADEAVELLLRRAAASTPAPGDDDRASAADVASELGCLPLAIDQAGAYISARKKSFREYLELYHRKKESLLGYKSKLSRQQKTVLITWDLSFSGIKSKSPDVASLLLLLCQYDNTYISDNMLKRGTSAQMSYSTAGEEIHVPPGGSGVPDSLVELVSDEIMFDEAVEMLDSYSLVRRATGGGFILHSLVKYCGQRRASEDERRASFDTAIRLLSHAFPRGSLDDWNTAFGIEFLPQVQHLCQRLEHSLSDGDDVVDPIKAMAASMFLSAYHFANTPWRRRFVELCGALLADPPAPGPPSRQEGLMTDRAFLAAFLTERRGKICPELGESERGIEILRAFARNPPDISGGGGSPGGPSSTGATAPNHLANSMHGCILVLLAHQLIGAGGAGSEALGHLRGWRPLGASSYSERSVARYRDRTLADLFVSSARWPEAESVLRGLLSAGMRDADAYAGTLGEGWTVRQLAEILMETGRHGEARAVLSPAIAAREAAGDLDREDTVVLMLDLVRCLLGQGSLDAAMAQLFKLRGVLARGTEGLGGDNSAASSQAVLGNLTHMWCLVARLSCYLGDFADAKACFERALETAGQVRWPSGFMVAAVRRSLGYARWKIGELDEEGYRALDVDVGAGDMEAGRLLTDAGMDREWIMLLKGGDGEVSSSSGRGEAELYASTN